MPQQPPRGGAGQRGLMVIGGALLLVAVAAIAVLASRDSPATGETSPPASTASDAGDLGDPFGAAFDARDATCSRLLECVRLTVPVDHAAPDSESSLEVRFGRHLADGDRTGVLVVATGGPGSSGLELAQSYVDLFPGSVTERYDIVFFAQRGVEELAPGCEDAELRTPAWAEVAELGTASAEREIRSWVDDCLEEAGVVAAELDRYATFQAAADLDAYLDHIDAGRVVIFGESYGTYFAQVYAAHRPERVAGLILDGVVDPAQSPVDQALEQAEGFGEVLVQVFDACGDDIFCAEDFPDGAATVWDGLAARLRGGPIDVVLPIRDGRTLVADLSLDDLVVTTARMMYTETERAMFLRSLASAVRDDLRPMVRLAALTRGMDPETGGWLGPATESGTAYYAIHCQGYPVTGAEVLGELHAGIHLSGERGRMAELAYQDLPCFGGFAGSAEPADLPDVEPGTYPTLVLTSTADPATPTWWAEAVAARLPNAYLIVTQGGSHGSFGWGFPCPDDLVKEFLVLGDLPDEARTECDGWVMDPYVPLPLGGPDAYPDVLEALVAVEESIIFSPDYMYRPPVSSGMGCAHGGWMEVSGIDEERFVLHACELLPGWPLHGTIIFGSDFFTTMSLTVPNGNIEYLSTDTWDVTVTGTIDGQAIDLSR